VIQRLVPLLLLLPVAVVAETPSRLDRLRERGELRWGMDSLGGAPYVFPDPADPSHLIGFEYELAEAIAKKLGVRLVPVQGQWDKLLDLVSRGDVDVAFNGIEFAEEKRRVVELSRPYYVSAQRIVVRSGDTFRPASVSELKGRHVGTLPASQAERILQRAGAVIHTYDGGQDLIYADLRVKRTDAVLLDDPVSRYYGLVDPALEMLPGSHGTADYVAAFAPDDSRFRNMFDELVAALAADGTLRAIYERWGLWNAETARLFAAEPEPSSEVAPAWEAWRAATGKLPPLWERLVFRYPSLWKEFAKGAGITLAVSVCAMTLAVLLGLLLAFVRVYGPAWSRMLSASYVELFRGTPLLVQLTIIYFGLPELGVALSPFFAGVLALGLNYAAAEAENYRAGLGSVPAGQLEAARALGLTRTQALRYVVAPQAFRVSLPPVTNDFIALLKDSALVSIVTLTDLTRTYVSLAGGLRDHLGLGLVVGAWYLALGLPFALLARRLERRLGRHLRRVT